MRRVGFQTFSNFIAAGTYLFEEEANTLEKSHQNNATRFSTLPPQSKFLAKPVHLGIMVELPQWLTEGDCRYKH